jgi:transcriptional regulator with XRE-family HTH domain
MVYDLEVDRSHNWSLLLEFGEQILIPARKKTKLTQKEISKRLGLNQSEVSRIERGITKPKDHFTIIAICEIYKLNPQEKNQFLQLCSGIEQSIDASTKDLLNDLLQNQIGYIAKLNRSGYPNAAIQHSANLRDWLNNYSYSKHLINDTIKEKLLHLLLEESAAWWDITLPNQVDSHTHFLISEMEHITQTINTENKTAGYFTKINKGFHSYIKGDYNNAYVYFGGIKKDDISDNLWQFEVLRASFIIAGKLRMLKLLHRYEKLTDDYLKKHSISDLNKGYLLEGLARGFIDINPRKSLKIFQKASGYIEQAKKDSSFLKIRYIQFVRSYIPLLRSMNEFNEKYANQLATTAIKEASCHGFIRHRDEILKLLKS